MSFLLQVVGSHCLLRGMVMLFGIFNTMQRRPLGLLAAAHTYETQTP